MANLIKRCFHPSVGRRASHRSDANNSPHPLMKETLVDDFSEAASWLAVASGQAQLKLTTETGAHGNALRMDFDFKDSGGFVVARKEFSMA